MYYACIAPCNQINLFAFIFSVQIRLFNSSSQSQKVTIMYFLKAFRLLGNRYVVVHLVLELQHENHVALNTFKFSTLKQCLGQTALSCISRHTPFKSNKQLLSKKKINKPVGDKIVRFKCEFKESYLALSLRCRFRLLEI